MHGWIEASALAPQKKRSLILFLIFCVFSAIRFLPSGASAAAKRSPRPRRSTETECSRKQLNGAGGKLAGEFVHSWRASHQYVTSIEASRGQPGRRGDPGMKSMRKRKSTFSSINSGNLHTASAVQAWKHCFNNPLPRFACEQRVIRPRAAHYIVSSGAFC